MSNEEWKKQGTTLFGADFMKWKFVCPVCNTIMSIQDYKDAGAPAGAIAFSCIGRYLPNPKPAFDTKKKFGNGPCDYSGGGLFKLNPVEVDGAYYFNFAPIVDDSVRIETTKPGSLYRAALHVSPINSK